MHYSKADLSTCCSFDLSLASLPVSFAKTGYQNSDIAANRPFQYGHGTAKVYFEGSVERLELLEIFKDHMAAYRSGRLSWMDKDFFPIETALENSDLDNPVPLLVNNVNMVPDQNAHWIMTGFDLLTMVLGAASERIEKQWDSLLNSVGLRIVKVRRHPEGTGSLVEADLLVWSHHD